MLEDNSREIQRFAPFADIDIDDSVPIAVADPHPSRLPRSNRLTVRDQPRADFAPRGRPERRLCEGKARQQWAVPDRIVSACRLLPAVDADRPRSCASVDQIRQLCQSDVASGCAWSLARAARLLEVSRWTAKALHITSL